MAVALTPETVGSYITITIIVYVITLGYSIYMGLLNYKQAKVKDILTETNIILRRIEKQNDR